MKRHIMSVLGVLAVLATAITFSSAAAETMSGDSQMNRGGLGFHTGDAPIGIRWWLSDRAGLDLAVGFQSIKNPGFEDETVTLNTFATEVGVPLAVKKWERATFIFRPGFEYLSTDQNDAIDALGNPIKYKLNVWAVTGELEAEVFLVPNVSVSATHGVAYESAKPDLAGATKETRFQTFGNNFTTIGFHVYLWK